MAIPDFGPDLFTGRDDIDDQHRRMFDAAHKVMAVQEGGPNVLIKAVRFLQAYVHYHFQAEEIVMEWSEYDRRDHHKRQHELIRQEVEAIRAGLRKGEDPRPLIARVQVLFENWYVFHIREVDTPFAQYIRKHNATASNPVALPSSSALVASGRLAPEFDGIELPGYRGDRLSDDGGF